MPQSYCNLLYHLVFSTKERQPWLRPELSSDLFPYLGGIIRGLGGVALAINGTSDHVHLLVRLRQKSAVEDVLRELKASSSGWVHKSRADSADFGWQNGYGAFTVSASQVDRVRKYILGQEGHHRRRDFKAEFVGLLDAHGVEYDERYIWA